MHPIKPLLGLLLVTGLHGCCASTELRRSASDVCDTLAEAMHARETGYRQLVEALLLARFQAFRSEIEARWAKRASELRFHVAGQIDAKRRVLCDHVRESIDKAMGPRLEEMSRAVDEAKDQIGRGAAETKKRDELALQLAATLAFTERAILELQQKVDVSLESVRREALGRIDTEFATPAVTIDPSAEVAALLVLLKSDDSTDYERAFDRGLGEVRRFINLDSNVTLVLKGLFGESIGARLLVSAEAIGQKKLQELATAAEQRANKVLRDLDTQATRAVSDIPK